MKEYAHKEILVLKYWHIKHFGVICSHMALIKEINDSQKVLLKK